MPSTIAEPDLLTQIRQILTRLGRIESTPRTTRGFDLTSAVASYTLVRDDAGHLVEVTTAGASTLTVPPNSTIPFPVGTFLRVRQGGAGQVTVTAGAGVTIRSRNGLKLAGQWGEAYLTKRGTDEWVLSGDTIP